MITVAIIEDNRLVREGMTDMLNELPDVEVVLAATSLDASMLKEKNPRVVLLDVGLQDRKSLRLAEAVQKEIAEALMATVIMPAADYPQFSRPLPRRR